MSLRAVECTRLNRANFSIKKVFGEDIPGMVNLKSISMDFYIEFPI